MMLVFSYDDGDKIATVTWTADYGFIAAGDREILERLSYEERTPRAPVVVGQTRTVKPIPIIGIPDDDDFATGNCFSCGCPQATHETADGGPCASHGCSTFVP